MNLIQMVEFPTWSRIINNVLRESIYGYQSSWTGEMERKIIKNCIHNDAGSH